MEDDSWDSTATMLQQMQQAIDPKSEDAAIKVEILENLKPCAKCAAPRRYGETNDGGYAMCSKFIENGKLHAGYSFGVAGYDGWGKDISTQYHVPIYQFDCTNPKRPTCPGCDFHFFDLCVTADRKTTKPSNAIGFAASKPKSLNDIPANKYKTIKELMGLNGHGTRGNVSDLIMQLDVEGYEWNLFANPETTSTMLEFSQVSVEFHNVLKDANYKVARDVSLETRLQALKNLNKYFVVTHIHGNNARPLTKVGEYSTPMLLEVLYVRRDHIPTLKHCETDPKKWKQDARNVPKRNDLDDPVAHLP